MQNTFKADVNEISFAYIMNNCKWFNTDIRKHYEQRCAEISSEDVEEQFGRAEAMVEKTIEWAKKNSYETTVEKVWWTARPNSIDKIDIDYKKNPTDILVKFKDGPSEGYLGISAKSCKVKSIQMTFKNPGMKSLEDCLDIELIDYIRRETNKFIKKYNLPKKDVKRKPYIRKKKRLIKAAEKEGYKLLTKIRNRVLLQLETFSQKQLKKLIIGNFMDAEKMFPEYIRVTGYGRKGKFNAKIEEPKNFRNIKNIEVVEVNDHTIGFLANGKHLMRLRFKFCSQKFASSIKAACEEW